MFTGIVTHAATLLDVRDQGGDSRMVFRTDPGFLGDCREGDSIAVSGVCLTAVIISGDEFEADVSLETLRCTTMGQWKPGQRVNLERPMRADGRFDGHMVSGHVDGTALLVSVHSEARSNALTFEVAQGLSRFIAEKGSVCLDGVSLTVNEVNGNRFVVNIIPHTQEVTGLGELMQGESANIEVDLVARYVQRLIEQQEKSGR